MSEFVIDMGSASAEWCDDCHHWSLVVAPLARLTDSGVTLSGELRRCVECHPFEDDDE